MTHVQPNHVITVRPAIPDELRGLRDLAYDLWWAWSPGAQDIFRRIDPDAWQTTQHNPVALLGHVTPDQLAARATDSAFVHDLHRVVEQRRRYLETRSWFRTTFSEAHDLAVAYFSMEYGITESVPLYSGGLGVLAGDHVKAASDLGVPLVAVGMLYRQGYFRQTIDPSGGQQELHPETDFYSQPVTMLTTPDGSPLTVGVPITDRWVEARVWRMNVGRCPVLLLDANVPGNAREDRELTAKLYQGDSDVRIRQEILLGIGGMRALQAAGVNPTVLHLNEGHSAFALIERLRELQEGTDLSFEAALETVRAGGVFTTHTPVPAGHDEFHPHQVAHHLGAYLNEAGIESDRVAEIGQYPGGDRSSPFCMTILALRGAAWRNGVSQLHGEVTRRMWQSLWHGVPWSEVPIQHVTNGVHLPTWVSRELADLLGRYLGPEWALMSDRDAIREGLDAIPDDELWRVHNRRRERLVTNVRRRLRAVVERRWGSGAELADASSALQPNALTIGFARRIALYKRPTLLLHDLERLRTLVTNARRPVQVIFAGKAHPDDAMAKDLVREIHELSRDPGFVGRVVFVEDYDMDLARDLVQGCDVWLNQPVRPQEASGTSGMKAAANGVLNVSVLDGWWAEAYAPHIGWAIGRADDDVNDPQHDANDASAVYRLLERSVVPLFYDLGLDGTPTRWIERAKASMVMALTDFGAHRMMRQYTEEFYLPADELHRTLSSDSCSPARSLADWLARVREQWTSVQILDVNLTGGPEVDVGSALPVRARVSLNGLHAEELTVQVYVGRVGSDGAVNGGVTYEARPIGPDGDGTYWFESTVPLRQSGRMGIAVRVVPRHPHLTDSVEHGLVRWSLPGASG